MVSIPIMISRPFLLLPLRCHQWVVVTPLSCDLIDHHHHHRWDITTTTTTDNHFRHHHQAMMADRPTL